MEEKILVSVVIPTYNQKKFFKRAIDSVINQTYSNLEIIVVDDNNIEEYSQYVHEYVLKLSNKYRNIRYVKNKINKGSVYSRNVGIKTSQGEYITFLDDDDFYREDKVKSQLMQMIIHKSDYSVCNISLTDNWSDFKVRKRNFINYNESLIKKHMKYHIAATSTFMFKSEFLLKIGGFSQSDFGDDYYLIEKAIKKSNKFIHVDYVGVVAYLDSNKGLSSWENKIITEEKLLKHKLSQNIDLSPQDLLYIKMRHHAVKGVAYFRGRRPIETVFHLGLSFFLHPLGFIKILLGKDL